MKKYEVAVLYDTQGKVIGALKVKMVDDNEFKQLQQATEETLENRRLIIEEMQGDICKLNGQIHNLLNEIKVLKGEE